MREAAVTDTHPLLFHARRDRRLSKAAAAYFDAAERREGIIYVPTAVVLECSLLARTTQIDLKRSVRDFFDDLFGNPAYQPLDITAEQVYVAEEIRTNRDLFDGLICAAALTLSLPLITRDGDIRASGRLEVIW